MTVAPFKIRVKWIYCNKVFINNLPPIFTFIIKAFKSHIISSFSPILNKKIKNLSAILPSIKPLSQSIQLHQASIKILGRKLTLKHFLLKTDRKKYDKPKLSFFYFSKKKVFFLKVTSTLYYFSHRVLSTLPPTSETKSPMRTLGSILDLTKIFKQELSNSSPILYWGILQSRGIYLASNVRKCIFFKLLLRFVNSLILWVSS